MKEKAMNVKLVVRPIIGCLTHSHFWEGPCRAGYAKDMTPEAENAAAEAAFTAATEILKGATPEIDMLPAIDARYDETFVVSREVYAQIEERMVTRASTSPPIAAASAWRPTCAWTCAT